MVTIEKAFTPENHTVSNFFHLQGVGFYIPLYQREYSWDKENIAQLTLDIQKGVENISNSSDEIRYLGTIILVRESDPHNNIEPKDTKAIPQAIDLVIDGQQRLSTLALIGTKLYQHLNGIEIKLKKNSIDEEIRAVIDDWKLKLLELFSFDLKRGKPTRKPIIIRGNSDQWVLDGKIDSNYQSDISNYLAKFIDCIETQKDFNKIEIKKSKVSTNLKELDNWLRNDILSSTGEFISSKEILENIPQKYLWIYERENFINQLNSDSSKYSNILSDLLKLCSICYYLLDRCCFTVIKPIKEDWAFDLFQSLNATGTPLTAIETFLPLVVNTFNQEDGKFKDSQQESDFKNIDDMFSDTNTANQKNKLTNDYLTSLALSVNGYQMTSHFSDQRKWLIKSFSDLDTIEDKKLLIEYFGNYSIFYKKYWIDYKGNSSNELAFLHSHKDKSKVSMLFLFLKNSNHKMAITILGNFYNKCEISKFSEESIDNFVAAVKIISSFYVLWRGAKPNNGLDKVYRDFLKKHNFQNDFSIDVLKELFFNNISADIKEKTNWIKEASVNTTYKNKQIVKLLLLIYFTDTESDENGLVKQSKVGYSNYFELSKYLSEDLSTIEHIAPQKQNINWDDKIYSDKMVDSLGNLTLLNTELNSSIGNRGWKEKLFYYKYLKNSSELTIDDLERTAKEEEIFFSKETLSILKKSKYNKHIEGVAVNDLEWNSDFIFSRTNNILEICYDRILELSDI